MSKTSMAFKLTRPARKSGGDRYEYELAAPNKPIVIYVPQSISRTNHGKVIAEVIDITFEPR